MPYEVAVDLVDLGNDYFAVMLFEDETDRRAKDLTIVIFKLLSERGGDGALSCALVSTRTCNATENGYTLCPIYYFIL